MGGYLSTRWGSTAARPLTVEARPLHVRQLRWVRERDGSSVDLASCPLTLRAHTPIMIVVRLERLIRR